MKKIYCDKLRKFKNPEIPYTENYDEKNIVKNTFRFWKSNFKNAILRK